MLVDLPRAFARPRSAASAANSLAGPALSLRDQPWPRRAGPHPQRLTHVGQNRALLAVKRRPCSAASNWIGVQRAGNTVGGKESRAAIQ